ncbi:MAG: hypothetical protein WBP12_04315 [Candidatus Saccharimonas sp.]
MKRLLKILSIPLVALALVVLTTATPVLAVGTISDGADAARGAQQPTNLFGDSGIFSQISSVLLFIVGAIAVIMIVIGGLRYVISGGDASQVQSAKNTILYALVGVIVAILAYAAVNFVIHNFTATTNTSGANGSFGASTR